MRNNTNRTLAGALALSLGLALAGCGGTMADSNRSLNSIRQPVVERANYTLDIDASQGGLPVSEQQRLAGWFEAMDLRYGDRISIDDPVNSLATREAVSALAGRYGLLVAEGSPVTEGYVAPGQARVVITRSTASVPGCPDWSVKHSANYENATSPGFGCGVNSNLAAMIANPEDLIAGQAGTGETVVTTSTKAINAYRAAEPTGVGGLAEVDTEGE
jgi:pilus assembly protein CpaD